MSIWASLVVQKNLPTMQETQIHSPGWEDSLEEEMATNSSTLAWRIPWTEELGELESMESQNVRYDWVTNTHMHVHPKFPNYPVPPSFCSATIIWFSKYVSLFLFCK